MRKKIDATSDKWNNRGVILFFPVSLEEGAGGFKGGMNAGKYASICIVSKATATRDLQHLASLEALIVSGGDRSTNFRVKV